MPAERREWSDAELLVTFRLYCRTAFGRLHQHNPEIIRLAELIGRTSSAVAMKACNFASLDPQQQVRGIKALGNVSRADRELWEAFRNDSEAVAQEAEAAYATLIGKDVEDHIPELGCTEMDAARTLSAAKRKVVDEFKMPDGTTERDAVVKTRRVQSFFRATVLASYDGRCALTGLAIPELLNASHIIPWSVDEKRRADPCNGICLNAFHDRVFDRGLISFDENLCVIVSPIVGELGECDIHRQQLLGISGRLLRVPERFQPDTAALDYHRKNVFRR
ncbi:MAG: HNH endonuclease [Phycisphaerae bacterium]|nr:HNH endonuclease [Phycisphaerae bacterium]